MMRAMKIAVLGLWHLGEIYAAGLAELGHRVIGVDENGTVAASLQRGIPPLQEPRLEGLLRKHLRSGRLRFSADVSAIRGADALWVTFDTPVDTRDRADTGVIFFALRRALRYLPKRAVVVVSSQLPVGTSRRIQPLLQGRGFAYVPENLRLGEAVGSFMHPGRVVIGASDSRSYRKVARILSTLSADVARMDPASAEMVKHALNAFLATSLSFIYDIADVCEREGADVLAVSRALKSDPRIGQAAYLDASLGFSGGTLGRDLQYLKRAGARFGLRLPVISAAYKKNRTRRLRLFDLLSPLGTLRGKRIAVLGLTYKAGTATLRRSLALELAQMLSRRGARLTLYDPAVCEDDVRRAWQRGIFVYAHDVKSALSGAHAAVLVTPWAALARAPWKTLARAMRRPRLLVDARNALASSATALVRSGMTYRGVGRPVI